MNGSINQQSAATMAATAFPDSVFDPFIFAVTQKSLTRFGDKTDGRRSTRQVASHENP
jgi:hypothetical protein